MRGAACRQGNNEVFLHMSNHYRRMYNAKSTIDASAPHSYKRQQSSSRTNLSPCDLALVDIITSDTKQSPNTYANHAWLEKGQHQERCRTAYRPLNRNYCKKVVNKESGNNEVFLHMSNHYRRMYNAKSTIDASAPHSYKRQQSSSRTNLSPCDLALVDIITSDTKQSPNTYANHAWLEKGQHQERCRTAYRPLNRNYCKKVVNKIPTDLIDRHAENFENPNKPFKPRILKSDAQSRVREMREYHPPCRRRRSRECRSEEEKWKEEVASVQLSDLCSAKKAGSSKESSRDSAYNGGISSGADTPEQTSPVSGICRIEPSENTPIRCRPRKTAFEAGSCVADNSPTRQADQPLRSISYSDSSPTRCQKILPTEQSNCMREDAAYVQFIHDITEDVLVRGIYSDRGLRQLFERHVADNEGRLCMERMREEVAKLSQQLGISGEDTSKGERSECMSNFEDLKTECEDSLSPEKLHTEVNDILTRNKRNAMHNIAVPYVNDLENCREVLCAKLIAEIPDLETLHSKREEMSSDDNQNIKTENFPKDRPCIEESCPIYVCEEETEDKSLDFVSIGCQTSEISVTNRYAGSGTIIIPHEDLEFMLSEFVEDSDSDYRTFPYTRRTVTDATEEMINRLDKYDVLKTIGMRDEIVLAAAELVTDIMEKAVITYNIMNMNDPNRIF
ncbi:hypothetical protein C0J52_11665 [Blattella germanica]|nr:hypothetical protein C0J52_11665 [Blattella germanica]